MDLLAWLLLFGYVIYDWSTTRTWWLPWVFAALTILYGIWFYRRLCQSMARNYLQQLISRLRDQGVVPAGDDSTSQLFAECILSPTGRQLMLGLASPGAEPGQALYRPEAISILTAFAQKRRARGDGAELDANTLRWLKVRESLWVGAGEVQTLRGLLGRLIGRIHKEQSPNPGRQLDGPEEKTTNPPPPNRPTKLTERQVQQLIQLMDERVLKLCDGALYAIDGMRPDTEAAIHLESGLLLCLLYHFLSDGADCEGYWRRILFALCSKYPPDRKSVDLDKALEMARVYRKGWQDKEGQGPLLAVLAMGACMAFGVRMDNPKLVAHLSLQMAQEADPLITTVSRIIEGG